jgi:hypothetical protein
MPPDGASQYVVVTLAKGKLMGSVDALLDVSPMNAPATVIAKRVKVRLII